MRDSRTVLREAEGEVPLGYSPGGWGMGESPQATRLGLSVAISIDALAVGLTLSMINIFIWFPVAGASYGKSGQFHYEAWQKR